MSEMVSELEQRKVTLRTLGDAVRSEVDQVLVLTLFD